MEIKFNFERNIPITGIYAIRNLKNNNLYIGSSINIQARLEKHRSLLRGNVHENIYLQNAYNKYGENSFIFELLELETIQDNLIVREQFWIDNLKPKYNLCKDAVRHTFTEISKKKLSNSRKKLFQEGKILPNCSKSIDQYSLSGQFIKTWKTIKEASLYLPVSEDSIRKNIARKDFVFRSKFLFRIHVENPPEFIEIPSKKVMHKPGNNKPILLVDIITNREIYFKSRKDCAKYFKVTPSCIYSIIKTQRTYKNRYKLALIKSDKLLESPEEDNQQPITNLND